jgi:hypothetical protein
MFLLETNDFAQFLHELRIVQERMDPYGQASDGVNSDCDSPDGESAAT